MEKLLNLLNEFKDGKPFKFTGYDEKYGMFDTNLNMDGNTSLPEETIVCKKFGFIKWLIENNKVNIVKEVINDIEYYGNWQIENVDCYSQYDSLLMLLSIQDQPIEFLISILK